jgi:mannonate dehydratase
MNGMTRRGFAASAAASVAACSPLKSQSPSRIGSAGKPVRMYVGTQRNPTTPEMLDYFKRHGVEHIAGYSPSSQDLWTVETLTRTREMCEEHGVALDFVVPSGIRSRDLVNEGAERDRAVEGMRRLVADCAEAGVPAVKYNLSFLSMQRTGTMPGRGGSHYGTWRWADAKQKASELTEAGRIEADVFWERIDFFLRRVVPVADEHKIRIACHPHDPGVPPEGYRGVDRVLGTVEGLKKFVSMHESPYHGLNLCLGTTAEMLQDPNREIHDVIRYFGERRKIFNIHFRNIKGRRDEFMEVWPDEGDMNMAEVARTLHEVDYPYMVMPDHMPRHPDDPDFGRQAFAFGFGYIKAILQALGTGV